MPLRYGTQQHWENRAKEARTMAEGVCIPEARCAMLAIAENYDRLAKIAEAQDAGVLMSQGRGGDDA